MKVKKWKVLGLAGALVLGYAVSSNAGVMLKAGENTYADFGFWTQVKFDTQSKLDEGGKTTYTFDVPDARITIDGKMTKDVEFFSDVVMSASNNAALEEGGLNIAVMPEFQVRIGKIRVPFTREQLIPSYYSVVANGAWWDPQGVFNNSTLMQSGSGIGPAGLLEDVNPGVVFHGEIPGGLFKYAVGLFNEEKRLDYENAGLGVTARIEFTPVMLGFKPAPSIETKGWESDTYFGKAGDILTIGLGLMKTTAIDKGASTSLGLNAPDDLKPFGIGVDAFFEKKLPGAPFVLDLTGGFVSINDSHFYKNASNQLVKGDTTYYYAQAQGLIDQTFGIGKPAFYFRYEGAKADYYDSTNDATYNRFAVGCNYYIKDAAEKVNIGIDHVSYSDGIKNTLTTLNKKDSVTDFYVQLQVMF